MRVEPYLYFQGRSDEAIAFYGRAIGARTEVVTRFRDMPGGGGPPGVEDKVMHAVIRMGETVVMVSDGQNRGATSFDGFSLALSAASDAEAEQLFAALGEGGQVQMPLGPTPFATRFGMLVDRFGVSWTVVNPSAPA